MTPNFGRQNLKRDKNLSNFNAIDIIVTFEVDIQRIFCRILGINVEQDLPSNQKSHITCNQQSLEINVMALLMVNN